jgi:hypothetical protein
MLLSGPFSATLDLSALALPPLERPARPGDDAAGRLRELGYAHLGDAETLSFFGVSKGGTWADFAGAWNDLGPDRYMADGGRYRRRRHATLQVVGGAVARQPRQPHFQSRDYNPLNGDIQRWFAPVAADFEAHPITQAILRGCGALFSDLSGRPADRPWRVELHQFRIAAAGDAVGRPTPEGLHRDGVDWVFVMLVDRQNVAEGVTELVAPDGEARGRFTLATAGEAVLLDDHRILHGVTPIHAVDPARSAYRDVLVVTFA